MGSGSSSGTMSSAKQKADSVALGIGSRIGVGALLIASLLALMLGAAAMLDSLKQQESHLRDMSKNLAVTQEGLVVLNKSMGSVPPTSTEMKKILATVDDVQVEMERSASTLSDISSTTAGLSGGLADIASSTNAMRASLESINTSTGQLTGNLTEVNQQLGPLVKVQDGMLNEVKVMRQGTRNMNASLLYVVRVLNYLSAPPAGGGFTASVEPSKAALPNLPGLKTETNAVEVFPRNVWQPYTGS